jgi:hypothetical protein
MGEIRTFREEDAPDIAGLYMSSMRGGSGPPPGRLTNYFREIFLHNPWASPDLPSLLYCEGGQILAFLGVIPRSMEFSGRPIRIAVATQFMVDRQRHRGPAALQLLRHFFAGPQDLSYTDGAGEEAHLVWRAAGAQGARLYSFHWFRPLRPVRAIRHFADRTDGLLGLLANGALAAAAPLDSLLTRLPGPLKSPDTSYVASTEVTPKELLHVMTEIGWREPLKPLYQEEAFAWLMAHSAAARSRGDLHLKMVRATDGRPCGWYVYHVKPAAPASVLQIGVRRRDQFDQVFQALLRDAWEQGASAVKGLSVPPFLVNLTNQFCIFRQPTTCVLFYSRFPELTDVILRGDAALSGLDGERWLDFTGHYGN